VSGTIRDSERDGATVILQLDSRGSYGREAELLARTIRSSSVPVVVWVGPSGARASGGALYVLYSASLATMAPGAGVGPGSPFDLATSVEDPDDLARRTAELAALAPGAQALPEGARAASDGPALPAGPALAAGAVALVAVDVPDLLAKLDGRSVQTAKGTVVLATANRPGRPVDVRFHEIGPVRGVLHSISVPTAVYVVLVLGLWALAFELTQPGVGVAGIASVLALGLAVYGLAVVPVHGAGLAMLLAGTALLGLDVVIRRVQWLTAGGAALFAAGSVLAWRGVAPTIHVSLWLVGAATLGRVLFFGFAMTVALRSRERVRTAQVGLVGLLGEARSDLNPEGGVLVKGSLWRARTTDGHIPKGARIRVRGVEGLILRVDQEPE
jgi:membrane-bound serine protease (ClpP class)